MSHLLVVYGGGRTLSDRLFRSGVSLFKGIHGLSPLAEFGSDATQAALFPHKKAPTPAPVQFKHGWICGAGTWFYDGLCGEQALRRMTETFQTGSLSFESWLRTLEGVFAIVVQSQSGLVVLTDRLGQFHLYKITTSDGCEVICTSALVLASLIKADWDLEGCRQFLVTGVVFEPGRTLFRDIEKLKPARVYQFFPEQAARQNVYWDFTSFLYDRARVQGDVQMLLEALDNAVKTICRSFPKPVSDLTGGYDTRGVVGALLHSGLDVDVITNGDDRHPDVVAASRISQTFGLRHHRSMVQIENSLQWWRLAKASVTLLDGEQDVLYYAPVLYIHEYMADSFNASINGGIGEICGGHWWEIFFPTIGQRIFNPSLIARRRLLGCGETPGLMAEGFPESLEARLTKVVRDVNLGQELLPNTAHMDTVYLTLWEQRFYGRTVSASSHIWPVISPYGFRGVLETALSAPIGLRSRRRMHALLVERQCASLAALPLAQGYPAEPIRLRNIHRFRPLLTEYRSLIAGRLARNFGLTRGARREDGLGVGNPLAELCEIDEVRELLEPASMTSSDIYDWDVLRRTVAQYKGQRNDYSNPIGRLLTLELVARIKNLKCPSRS